MSSSPEIEILASRSEAFSSYSPSDMENLCNDLLTNFRDREYEWTEAGEWLSKEGVLLGKFEDGKSPSDDHLLNMKFTKQTMSAVMSDFLGTCMQHFKYVQGKSSKKPNLLEKERVVNMQDGSGRFYSVYGPVQCGFPGMEFELYTLPSKGEGNESKKENKKGSFTVILGAGNQPMLTLTDVLQRTMVHQEVVLIKHHPLRPHLLAPYSILLEPLVKLGFVHQVLDSGIPETKKILSHKNVGHIHLTGSLQTDISVRETILKGNRNLSQNDVDGMISSELGACTPFVLANAKYTEKEIIHAARNIVASKKTGGGCNCLDAQAVVIAKDWEQKDEFRKALYDELKRQPNEKSYYPGSVERAQKMIETYKARGKNRVIVVESPESTAVMNRSCDNVAVVECGSPGDDGYEDYALRLEAFGPVLAIVELSNGSNQQEDFLASAAVPFLNNKENIFGSLSCSILVPDSFDKNKLSATVENLEYGSIIINTLPMFGYLAQSLGGVWCAHPSAPGRQSGAGYIGNQFKISSPAKQVVYGPSLTSAPLIDLAKLPPPVLIDALTTMKCSHSTFTGTLRILKLVSVRLIETILSSILPTKGISSVFKRIRS